MNKASEVDCEFVSSRGILKSCDIHSNLPISSIRDLVGYSWNKLDTIPTIYVCTSAMARFVELMDQLPGPFILVSGDADESAPTDIFKSELDFLRFIENPKIKHWFGQNGVVPHLKFSQIPIGLDYHTMSQGVSTWGPQFSPLEQENLLKEIRNAASVLVNRKMKAHANFHFLMNTKFGFNRLRALEFFPESLVDYEPRRTDRETTWRNQSNYAFVISPWGNGLDCHRTWEALCLGCIPVLCTSPLDPLFEGLPVYIVKDWAEVTEETLKHVHQKFSKQTFNLERLTLKYWTEKINSKKTS